MPEWISVKDRLPDHAQTVLIAEYDPSYSSAPISGEYFTHEGFVYVDSRVGMRRGVDVRYWMPLPPIPRPTLDLDFIRDLLKITDE